jgi:hypothetical protein
MVNLGVKFGHRFYQLRSRGTAEDLQIVFSGGIRRAPTMAFIRQADGTAMMFLGSNRGHVHVASLCALPGDSPSGDLREEG